LLDLIIPRKLQCGAVMAFIDILVDIFDGLYRDADFNIDVAVVLCTEERIVWDHIPIVKCTWRPSWSVNCMCSAIVWSCKLGITIFSESRLCTECLWEVLGALSILDALLRVTAM
jgi:hypothetical protein